MIDLTKVEQKAPHMVDLTKRAGGAIAMRGLGDHAAGVLLVLDVSPSANGLYRAGAMQKVGTQAFAVALNFDDDGAVPTAMFDSETKVVGDMTLDNCQGFIDREAPRARSRRGGTVYTKAINWARSQAAKPGGQPTYVIFATDGEPNDSHRDIEKTLTEASREPLFFQFIGVGPGVGTVAEPSFPYLERLDEMGGRTIDNAGFFAVGDPNDTTDDDMLNALLSEYPSWVGKARAAGLIR